MFNFSSAQNIVYWPSVTSPTPSRLDSFILFFLFLLHWGAITATQRGRGDSYFYLGQNIRGISNLDSTIIWRAYLGKYFFFWICSNIWPKNKAELFESSLPREGVIIDFNVSWSSVLWRVTWRSNVTNVLRSLTTNVRKRNFNPYSIHTKA